VTDDQCGKNPKIEIEKSSSAFWNGAWSGTVPVCLLTSACLSIAGGANSAGGTAQAVGCGGATLHNPHLGLRIRPHSSRHAANVGPRPLLIGNGQRRVSSHGKSCLNVQSASRSVHPRAGLPADPVRGWPGVEAERVGVVLCGGAVLGFELEFFASKPRLGQQELTTTSMFELRDLCSSISPAPSPPARAHARTAANAAPVRSAG